MTKDEFIADYIARSGGQLQQTTDGFRVGDKERRAEPCACGDPECGGWQMVDVGVPGMSEA